MSDTQQAARALLDKLHASYSDPEEAMRNYSDDLALIILVITQAEQRGMERAAVVVREKCGGCSGTGYGRVSWDEHGNFVDGDECEYCGYPMQAIRATKENMGSACLDCGGSYAACLDWRSSGKPGCCPDCRHSLIRAAKEAR